MTRIDDAQRRTRLARRHALAPDSRADSPEQAVAAMVCLHATEPATVYLSALARVVGFERGDLDRAMYDDRTLVKQLAMRRTLFLFPTDLLGTVLSGPSARVADQQVALLLKDLRRSDMAPDPAGWLDGVLPRVLDTLVAGARTTAELRELVPELSRRIEISPDKPYGGTFPIAPRVLTLLGAQGRVVRGRNEGSWRLSRPAWTLIEQWLGEVPADMPVEKAFAELIRGWLRAFGPGTEDDVVWWFGTTKTTVRRALAEVGAVSVETSSGPAYVLPDDIDPVEPVEPWAALLPVLDPTTMGWKERDWYLAPHREQVFDSNGNGGQTAWWDGRVVGGWHQTPDGEVVLSLLEDVGSDARTALDAEAARLGEWLDGEVVSSIYKSPLHKRHLA